MSRVYLEGAPEGWHQVVQVLEGMMNQRTNLLRKHDHDSNSVVIFEVHGNQYIATCNETNYVDICLLRMVSRFTLDVAFFDLNYEPYRNWPRIPASVIQEAKQSNSKIKLAQTFFGPAYLVYNTITDQGTSRVKAQQVEFLSLQQFSSLKSAVMASKTDGALWQTISRKSPERSISVHPETTQQRLIKSTQVKPIPQPITQPLVVPERPFQLDPEHLCQIFQDIERDMKNDHNYLRVPNGKFGLYRVENQFYMVIYDEYGFLNINPLDIVEQIDSVDTADPQEDGQNTSKNQLRCIKYEFYALTTSISNDSGSVSKSTTVRSLSSLPLAEVFEEIQKTALKKPLRLLKHTIIPARLDEIYKTTLRQISKPTRCEENVELEFMSRLFEPLKIATALRLQSSCELIREAIWQTKWKFSLQEFSSTLTPLTNMNGKDCKKLLNQWKNRCHMVNLIVAWFPHIRHFLFDVLDHDIYMAIYLFMITESPRLMRLEIQPADIKNLGLYSQKVCNIHDYTVLLLGQNIAFAISELITVFNLNVISLNENRDTLQGWIRLVGGPNRLTRFEWPALFRGFAVNQPLPHLPNLRSLTVTYEDINAERAKTFIEANPTVVELDVVWKAQNPVNVKHFLENFLAPLRHTLYKLRLTFEWKFYIKGWCESNLVYQAMESLSQVSRWQMEALTHLELGLCNIPPKALEVISLRLTSAPCLQTLAFLFTPGQPPTFPVQISARIRNVVLNNLVFDFSRLDEKLVLPEKLQNMLEVNYVSDAYVCDKTRLQVLNLTFDHVQNGVMLNKLLEITANDFHIYSTLQFRGNLLTQVYDSPQLTTIINTNSKLNHLVLMTTRKMHWPRSVFQAILNRGREMEQHRELQLNGALFYFDHNRVCSNSGLYMAYDLLEFDYRLHYFRLHY